MTFFIIFFRTKKDHNMVFCEIRQFFNSKHKFFKSGEIVDIEENGFITVKFGNTVKKLSLITLVVSNLLIIDEESIKQKLDEFNPLLIKEKSIPFLLTIAEENFEPYEKYIQ